MGLCEVSASVWGHDSVSIFINIVTTGKSSEMQNFDFVINRLFFHHFPVPPKGKIQKIGDNLLLKTF